MEELTDREIDSILNALWIAHEHYKEKSEGEFVDHFTKLADGYHALYVKVRNMVID